MDIQGKADKYIGHPREVDEGYEVSMRRTAYMDGYQAAVNDMKSKVVAMRDNYLRQMEVKPRPQSAVMLISGKLEAAQLILDLINQ